MYKSCIPLHVLHYFQEVEPNVGEKLCRLWQKIETDDDVLSGRDQRGGASGGHSGGGNSSTSMPHSGHMTHFASRPGLPYPPVYPHYGYPPMGQMFASTHPGDARSRLTSQHMFHPPRLELQSMSHVPPHHGGSGGSYRPARPWWTIPPGAPTSHPSHPHHMPPFFPPYPPPHYHHHPTFPQNSNNHYGDMADNVPTFVPTSQYVPTTNPSPNPSSNPSTTSLSSSSNNHLSSSTSGGAHSSPTVHRTSARNAYSQQRANLLRQRQEQQRKQQQQQLAADKKSNEKVATSVNEKKEESTQQQESNKKSSNSPVVASGNGERRLFLPSKKTDQGKMSSRLSGEKKAQASNERKEKFSQHQVAVFQKAKNENEKDVQSKVSEPEKGSKSDTATPAAAKVADKKVKAEVESSELNGSGGRGKASEEEEAVVATTMAST